MIIAKQKADLAKGEMMLAKKQKEMQKVADMAGIEWRTEEARNRAKRDEALKQINAMLDARLAKAEEAEKAGKTAIPAADKPVPSKVAQP